MKRSYIRVGILLVGLVGLFLWSVRYALQREQYRLNATLVIAARDRQTDVALQALRQGADPNARGYMAPRVPEDPDDLLYDTKQDAHLFPALMLAADNGDVALVQALVDRKAAVNAQGPEGYTALIYSAFSHQPQATLILLKHGAVIEYHTEDGRSALDVATQLHRKQTVALLEQAEKGVPEH